MAVIGGGIAGLHCAYLLAAEGVDVTVYEAQDRVGGRMHTGRDPFGIGLDVELGGEFVDSDHTTMFALAEELGLTLDDRWAPERPEMVRDIWIIGGARVDSAVLIEQTMATAAAFSAAYDAAESDDTAFEELDNTSLAAWLDEHVPADQHAELHAVLRSAYTSEYGLEVEDQSCLNLIYLFGFDAEDEFAVFGDSDERYHVHEGNDAIPTALADALGGRVMTGTRLVSASGAGPFMLGFEEVEGGAAVEVTADHVVFALPFTLLRDIDLTDLALSDTKREAIDEIGMGTNAKLMGPFTRRPWWDDANESGSFTTDGGVHQGWDSSIGQGTADEGSPGVLTAYYGGTAGLDAGTQGAEATYRGALEELETIWPGLTGTWAGQVESVDWPTFPWTKGSYACYRPGQWRFWSTEGEREGNLHFCGEHTSLDFQGYMEGGAETGARAAAEILDDLGIGAPSPDSGDADATGTETTVSLSPTGGPGPSVARAAWQGRAARLAQRRA